MSCASRSYPKGSRPTLKMTFRDADGGLTDPSSIFVTAREPDGAQNTYDIADPEIYQAGTPVTGEWYFRFPAGLTEVGKWWLYVDGDGVVQETSLTITGVHVTV
jgi:hypothetical protein